MALGVNDKASAGAEPAGEQPTEGCTHDGASDEAETKPEIKYSPKGQPSRHAEK